MSQLRRRPHQILAFDSSLEVLFWEIA